LCGGGLEYLHRSSASRKRRQKWSPVPGGIAGPPCGDLALQVGGVPDESNIWLWVLRDSDQLVTALQTTERILLMN
jgi:hypothetical protein